MIYKRFITAYFFVIMLYYTNTLALYHNKVLSLYYTKIKVKVSQSQMLKVCKIRRTFIRFNIKYIDKTLIIWYNGVKWEVCKRSVKCYLCVKKRLTLR